MKLTVDIVEDFINTLDLSGDVISFSNDGANTTLVVAKTFHARAKMVLDIDGVNYAVVSVADNQNIVVAAVVLGATKYTVPNPFYFHGTPILTNAHVSGAKDKDKVPMIYLYEILKEKDLKENSRIERESDLRLFFLDNANFGEWDTEDHYSKRLLGINNLVDEFISAARKYSCCFYLYETDFTRINHVNWGVWEDNKGHTRTLFDDELTGVEVSFTLPLKKCN